MLIVFKPTKQETGSGADFLTFLQICQSNQICELCDEDLTVNFNLSLKLMCSSSKASGQKHGYLTSQGPSSALNL